jgi:hypothetical protein
MKEEKQGKGKAREKKKYQKFIVIVSVFGCSFFIATCISIQCHLEMSSGVTDFSLDCFYGWIFDAKIMFHGFESIRHSIFHINEFK